MHTEHSIQNIIYRWCGFKKKHPIVVPNAFWYLGEEDIISVNKRDFLSIFEIKISLRDFKNEFKNKKQKHAILRRGNASSDNRSIPNYFWYVCPEGIIPHEMVPSYAGLIEVRGRWPHVIKKAPRLHANKVSESNKLELIKKLAYRYWRYRLKYGE